jgi:uncharacterized protein
MVNEKKILKKTGKEEMKIAVQELISKKPKPTVKPVKKISLAKSKIKSAIKKVPSIQKPVVKKPITKSSVKPVMKKPAVKPKAPDLSQDLSSGEDAQVKSTPNMIQTSIPKLDGLFGGGIKRGSLTCVWAKQGVEGSEDDFIYQIANAGSKGGKVFYLANEKTPDSSTKEMKSLGFKGKINFIDATGKGSGKLTVDPNNADEVIKDLEIIVKKIKDPTIVIGSLSLLMKTTGQNTDLLQRLKDLNATVICLLKEDKSQEKFFQKIEELCDNIIKVNAVKDGIFIREYFFVTKSKGNKEEGRGFPFKVTKSEGIKIYLPKILITGPFGAGKTSFIHSASEKAVSVDRLGTTIALDHGHMKTDGFSVELFGTPGQQRFDPMLKMLGGESFGVVVVVSSIDPQGFPRAIEMMKKAEVFGLPVVIAANKADLRGAVKPEQIKVQMKLKDVEVIPVKAKDLTKVQPGLPCQLKMDDIEKVLNSILNKVMK